MGCHDPCATHKGVIVNEIVILVLSFTTLYNALEINRKWEMEVLLWDYNVLTLDVYVYSIPSVKYCMKLKEYIYRDLKNTIQQPAVFKTLFKNIMQLTFFRYL